jgi:hypothetical protein
MPTSSSNAYRSDPARTLVQSAAPQLANYIEGVAQMSRLV